MMETDREAFFDCALRILKTEGDSRGSHYLVTLLVAYDLLLPAICDPSLTKEEALALGKSALRIDSMIDVSLAKALADSAADPDGRMAVRDAARLMEVLSKMSDGTRILPSLMRMLRHPNPYVRSKAVKMIGLGSRSVRWVQNRLSESDPRVRANAIEALWGLDTDDARALLLGATRDGNNRVAGNALAALYRVGETSVIPEIIKMAAHESALFRSTAAWAMGESGDPRFSETLAGLMRDSSSAVRTRALSALGRIKAAVAASREEQRWVVSGLLQEPASNQAQRRMLLTVAGEEGCHFPSILPTHVLVSENNDLVHTYRLVERQLDSAMSVVFVVPWSADGPWTNGVQSCRSRKRPSDLWALSPYLAGETNVQNVPQDGVRFTTDPHVVLAALKQPGARSECTDLWHAIWRSVRKDQAQGRGKRHLIVFAEKDPAGTAGDSLVASIAASQASVEVIAQADCPKIAEFCRRTRCSLKLVDDAGEFARRVEMAYLHLLARYELTWHRNSAGPVPVRVRIHSPAGWGEANVD